ncbi:MAG: sulfite reductase subunit alpha [Roseateles sp.]|uniref:sulfite reductase subunit alpha n=1 Tax=Roseateles sp. TaxID=1971397 RepID=UPI0039E749F2
MATLAPERIALALLGVALYALLCGGIAWRQRRRAQAAAAAAQALLPAADGQAPLLVLHASQTGQAEEIAWQTARALHLAGVPVRLAALGEVTHAELQAAERALLIASTYGEGDAPDGAAAFVRQVMGAAGGAGLSGLHFGLLALGDSSYKHYCGFGRLLDDWLRRQGAQPLFECIEVDCSDAAALQRWREQLSHIAGTLDLPDWTAPDFQPWRLLRRERLNPGSQGEPVCHLELAPPEGSALPHWEAGDLVQMQPAADPQRPREYSIASLPADGRLHLLVRQAQRSDGSPGLASSQLCAQAAVGDTVALRLRAHTGFRIGDNAQRPLILIGNGTGLAGLRAHLKARAAQAAAPACWLLFGEREAEHDALYRADVEAWQRSGVLAHVDWVFSRDQPERRYVQHRLAEQAAQLREWVAAGAALYVCGSLQGMAGGVEDVLRDVLGDARLDELTVQGRYRRDVY